MIRHIIITKEPLFCLYTLPKENARSETPAPRGGASLAQPKTAAQALAQYRDDA
jgi:hypothetical protein